MTAPHYRQSTQRVERATILRKSMTEEEVMMWAALRDYRKQGFAFRRQAPVGPYVADFLCRKAKLIVEVDGSHHDLLYQIAHDQQRDDWLRKQGYDILRVSAHHVRTQIVQITADIDARLGLSV